MAAIVDDKSPICVPFILRRLEEHRKNSDQPFFVGLNGIQGAGKTTLVDSLISALSKPPYSLPTIALSIDDLYLPHDTLVDLAAAYPSNPLLQYRGQPSTHDIELGESVFAALCSRRQNIPIPQYDKSLHDGKGDRAPRDTWKVVNKLGERPVEIVLFEGWCVGFRALSNQELERTWAAAKAQLPPETDAKDVKANGRLGRHTVKDLQVVNDALRSYDVLTNHLQAFIHIDAEDTIYVYEWRLQQEAALRAAKGRGMTDEQVVQFVNGYYPAYELFLDKLRTGIFPGQPGRHIRMIVARDRKVVESLVI